MKILIVDDNIPILNTLVKVFKEHDVTPVDNFDYAIYLIAHNDYDVILSDYQLKPGNGIELLEMAHNIDNDVKLYLMTGFGESFSEPYIKYVFIKPFDIIAVRRMIAGR